MYYPYFNNSDKKVVSPEKIIGWLFYDTTMLGIGGFTFANAFVDEVGLMEKLLLGLASLIFFSYRIYILHLEATKKRREAKEQKELEKLKQHFKTKK